ncbi:MAG TPA: hypothetical protein VFM31_10145 [Nitrososphaeraceae archaeon]|jgi:hypothetical protein|nr:hypothetical protein [Nitrososphaeraceae archaeon]
MKCIVCERTRIENSEYCIYHNKARLYLKENYKKWNEAYSTTFTWNQYLVQLSKLKNVGVWIKEVIDLELKKVN